MSHLYSADSEIKWKIEKLFDCFHLNGFAEEKKTDSQNSGEEYGVDLDEPRKRYANNYILE